MDFLDPKLRRRHDIRLYIGYGLMGTLIAIITVILVFQAYGFDVDRKTGEVIQNGLVFVDSAPDRATVSFNGSDQKDKTNNRFALPSGEYDLRIKKDGYREWQRNFSLSGGEVKRYTYPMLIPTTLDRTEVKKYDAAPGFISGSPDRRWIIANQANSLAEFEEYDLNSLTNNQPANRAFTIPANVFTAAPDVTHDLKLVEWSSDNKHLLIKHTFGERTEFAVISRDQPTTSININTLLGTNPTTVALRDKKFDQWHLFTESGGLLQTADIKKTVTTVQTGVTAFKSHGSDTLLYSQLVNDGKTQRVTLAQGKDTYTLREVSNGLMYLDIARFDNSWYIMIGSDGEQRTYIYKDPVATLQKKDGTVATPGTVLKSNGPITAISFSQNTRFMITQSAQHFEVYDAEAGQVAKYDISNPFDAGTKVTWMDGHRLSGISGGKLIMFDFDGLNKQELVTSLPQAPALFDRDYTVLYSLSAAPSDATKSGLVSSQLRLAGDK